MLLSCYIGEGPGERKQAATLLIFTKLLGKVPHPHWALPVASTYRRSLQRTTHKRQVLNQLCLKSS